MSSYSVGIVCGGAQPGWPVNCSLSGGPRHGPRISGRQSRKRDPARRPTGAHCVQPAGSRPGRALPAAGRASFGAGARLPDRPRPPPLAPARHSLPSPASARLCPPPPALSHHTPFLPCCRRPLPMSCDARLSIWR
ncbi:formin-like protein 16 [Schistocerca americana]|uniref:formin-like protein 16 n=1 Tax=Schistocerca americana TaxID=7009 RepID=UPI001F4F867D|nr:formin-like protein 16 [Schistocerca americana]